MAYNRPMLLACVLQKLKPQVDESDVHLFLDGVLPSPEYCYIYKVPNSEMVALQDFQEKMFFELFPKGNIFRSKKNLGIALNTRRAREHIFDNYHLGLFLEDDLVIGPDYISQIRSLGQQLEDDPYVGFFNCYGDVNMPEEGQKALKADLNHMEHLWAYASWHHKYKKIKPFLDKYYAICEKADTYFDRNHDEIKKLFASWGFPQDDMATSQDTGFLLSMYKAGMCGVSTCTNNAIYIGFVGTHTPTANLEKNFTRAKHSRITHRPCCFSNQQVFEWEPKNSSVFFDMSLKHRWDYKNSQSSSLYTKDMPWLRWGEISKIETLLNTFKPVRVLEFGCGFSTLFFSRKEFIQKWLAIEPSDEWYSRISGSELLPNTEVKHVRKGEDFTRYLQALVEISVSDPARKFDLIIVDGCHRPTAVEASRHLVADGGKVLLHDYSQECAGGGYDEFFDSISVLAPSYKNNSGENDGLLLMQNKSNEENKYDGTRDHSQSRPRTLLPFV